MDPNAAGDITDIDVSDDQVDKFFNGEDTGLPDETTEQAEPATTEAVTEEQQSKQEPTEEQQRETLVPHGALHEERMRRKELQAQLEQTAERTRRMEEAFQKVMERQQAQAREEAEDLYSSNPIEALRQQNEQLQQRLQMYDQRFMQQDQMQEQYLQQQQFVSNYQAAAAEFASQTNDFQDAYNHLMQTRAAELTAAGFDMETVKQAMIQEESSIVAKAFNDGVNPGQRLYELAKLRGYQRAEQKAPEKTPEEVKMDTLEKGVQASKTLSGGSAKGEITLETLADMDDDDFDATWAKLIGAER